MRNIRRRVRQAWLALREPDLELMAPLDASDVDWRDATFAPIPGRLNIVNEAQPVEALFEDGLAVTGDASWEQRQQRLERESDAWEIAVHWRPYGRVPADMIGVELVTVALRRESDGLEVRVDMMDLEERLHRWLLEGDSGPLIYRPEPADRFGDPPWLHSDGPLKE